MVSYILKTLFNHPYHIGLNPYCSGQWSRTMTKEIELTFCESVLILIVVDNGLVQHQIGVWRKCTVGLNPYCSGQWSRTLRQVSMGAAAVVLILIVVDNGLVRRILQFLRT